MGFYLRLRCGNTDCGFSATVGSATEFYIDSDGVELPYGHPACFSPEAGGRGIAGYWRDLLCWECGHSERESIRLGEPIREPVLAWAMFPPPSLQNHPRRCAACEGILCDVGMLQMFMGYRGDLQTVRSQLEQRLAELTAQRDERNAKAGEENELDEYLREIAERDGDPIERIKSQLRDLATVGTPEELILYRLGLTPRLPVTMESLEPLKDAYMAASEKADALREEMFARISEEGTDGASAAPDTSSASRPDMRNDQALSKKRPTHDWFHSPAMKAKRALDAQMEHLRTLLTHRWVGMRLIRDERNTFDMFRRRCPRCKDAALDVSAYQT